MSEGYADKLKGELTPPIFPTVGNLTLPATIEADSSFAIGDPSVSFQNVNALVIKLVQTATTG